MAESAERRTEAGMKTAKNGGNNCPVGHARTVDESCGDIGAGGSRCDRKPHNVTLRHHCCGEGWEKAW